MGGGVGVQVVVLPVDRSCSSPFVHPSPALVLLAACVNDAFGFLSLLLFERTSHMFKRSINNCAPGADAFTLTLTLNVAARLVQMFLVMPCAQNVT